MNKTKAKGIAALFAFAVAVFLAALLCMGLPSYKTQAAETTEVGTPVQLAMAMINAQEGEVIQLTENLELDLTESNELTGYLQGNGKLFLANPSKVEGVPAANSQTLDLAGHSLTIRTGSETSCFEIEGITLTVTDSVGGGSVVGSSAGSFIIGSANSDLVLKDIEIEFTSTSAEPAAAIDTAGKLSLSGVTYALHGDNTYAVEAAEENVTYASFQDEINVSYGTDSANMIQLDANVTESLIIPAYANVLLDLNGKTLTNVDGAHTITNYGTLTVVDTAGGGTVDNISHGCAALINYGTAQIGTEQYGGGTFTRSKEAGVYGTSAATANANGNSWYTIANMGHLSVYNDGTLITTNNTQQTLSDGTTQPAGSYSSLVYNGYLQASFEENYNNNVTTSDKIPTLTVYGGRLIGGMNTIKSESGGIVSKLTVSGGEFENYTQSVLLNFGGAAISGGTFTMTGSLTDVPSVITTYDTEANIAITGGTFAVKEGIAEVSYALNVYDGANVAIEEAEFSGATYDIVSDSGAVITVSDSVELNAAEAEAGITRDGKTTYYGDFAEAVDAAEDKDVIVVYKDITTNGTLINRPAANPLNIELAIDLNGKTITSTNTLSPVFSIYTTRNFSLTSKGDERGAVNANYVMYMRAHGGELVEVKIDNIDFRGTVSNFSAFDFLNTKGVNALDVTISNITAVYDHKAKAAMGVIQAQGGTSIAIENSIIAVNDIVDRSESKIAFYAVYLNGATERKFASSAEIVNSKITVNKRENESPSLKGTAIGVDTFALTITGGEITSTDGPGVTFFGGQTIDTAADLLENDEIDSFKILTLEGDVAVTGHSFAVSGNGHSTQPYSGTVVNVVDATLTSTQGPGIYQPQVGIINVGENAVISGSSGIEIRAGELNVTGGTITATWERLQTYPIGESDQAAGGSSIDGAAIAISQHSTNKPISVSISGNGVFTGPAALYEEDLLNETENDRITASVTGGTFNSLQTDMPAVYSENMTGFVSGGTFGEVPNSGYLADGFVIAETEDGYEAVSDVGYVAAVTNEEGRTVSYKDLQEAINKAENGDTIVLLDNIKAAQTIVIDKSVTIDGGGEYSISSVASGIGSLIQIQGATASDPGVNISVKFQNLKISAMDGQTGIETLGGGVTLNLNSVQVTAKNGTALNVGGDARGTTNSIEITVENNSTLDATGRYGIAILNTAELTVSNTTIYGWAAVYANDPLNSLGSVNSVIEITGSSTLITDNTGRDAPSNDFAAIVLNDDNIKVTIEDTDISVTANATSHYALVRYGAKNTNVSITGGSITMNGENLYEAMTRSGTATSADVHLALGEGVVTNYASAFLADGCSLTYNEAEGTFTVSADAPAAIVAGYYSFADLQAAVDVAGELGGETVQLLNDVELTQTLTIDKTITLDLNGHSITNSSGTALSIVADGVTVTDNLGGGEVKGASGNNIPAIDVNNAKGVTISKISITGANGIAINRLNAAPEPWSNRYVSEVAVEDVKISGCYSYGIGVWGAVQQSELETVDENSYTKLTVTGSEITADIYAVAGNGTYHGTSIVIEDSTLISNGIESTMQNPDVKGKQAGDGIFHPQYGNLEIKGETTIKGPAGIEMRAGILVIADDSVTVESTSDAANFFSISSGSGNTLGGVALGVSQHLTELGISVIIEGGTFTAKEGGYAFYETDNEGNEDSQGVTVSIEDGTFTGGVYSQNLEAFIEGGKFSEALPVEYLGVGIAQQVGESVVTVAAADKIEAMSDSVAMLNGKTAFTTLQAAFDAAEGEATITLLRDIVYGENETIEARYDSEYPIGATYPMVFYSIDAGKAITLDMNGKKIDFSTSTSGESYGYLLLKNLGDLTITGDGTFISTTADIMALIGVFEDASLTVESGTFDTSYMAIYMSQNAEANVSGGTFQSTCFTWFVSYIALEGGAALNVGEADKAGGPEFIAPEDNFLGGAFSVYAMGSPWKDGEENNTDGITVNIYDGKFGSPVGLYEDGCAVQANIYGGTFAEAVAWDMNAGKAITGSVVLGQIVDEDGKVTLNVTGGSFEGALVKLAEEGDIAISGTAAFADMPPYSYFKEDYAAVWNGEMYVTTEGAEFVAAVGEYAYTTVAEAVANAEEDATVELLGNVTLSETLVIGKPITLDLGGYTLTSSADVAVQVTADAALANGKLVAALANGKLVAADGATALAVEGAAAELNGVNVTGGTQSATAHLYLVTVENGALTLDASTIKLAFAAAEGTSWQGQALRTVNSDVTIRNNSVIESDDYGVTFRGGMTMDDAFAAETAEGFKTLTIADSSITAQSFAVSGNGSDGAAYPYSGTSIIITGNSKIESKSAQAIYHPQYGELLVELNEDAAQAYIKGTSGIEMRAGKLNVVSGTIIATGTALTSEPNGNGSTTEGAAIAIVQHTTQKPINVQLAGGTYEGLYAVYEENQQNNPANALEDISLKITGGTYNGDIGSQNLTGFISGGRFKQQPAAEYMDPDYVAEYRDGYYVPVESTALRAARANAEADVRAYAASLGMVWEDIKAIAADSEAADRTLAQTVLDRFAVIAEATSEKGVAEARVDAMNAVDDLVQNLADYKSKLIAELQALALNDSATEEDELDVVVPTATYLSINSAASMAEAKFYYDNAVAEINDIRAYRAEIASQTEYLEGLAQALGDLGEETLLQNIEEALTSIVVGSDTDSATLAGIYNYLETVIKESIGDVNKILSDKFAYYDEILEALQNGLLTEGDNSFTLLYDKIEQYLQGNIIGGEDGLGSISDKLYEANNTLTKVESSLNEAIAQLFGDGSEGNTGSIGAIMGALEGLQGSLDDETNGLAAIIAKIDGAQGAILGAADEEGNYTDLSKLLEAINNVNSNLENAMQELNTTLTGLNENIAAYKATLDAMSKVIVGSEETGDLFEQLQKEILAAQAAITGGEGNSIASAVEDLNEAISQVAGQVVALMPKYDEQLTNIGELLAQLQAAVDDNGTEIGNVLQTVKDAQEAILGAAGTDETEATGLAAVMEAIAAANGAVADAQEAILDAINGADGLASQLANIGSTLTGFTAQLNAITGALNEDSGWIAEAIEGAQGDITNILTAIGSLADSEDIAGITGSLSDILADIAAVQSTVDEISVEVSTVTAVQEAKDDALVDIEAWLNNYLDSIIGGTDEASGGALVALAFTAETTDGDIYAKLTQAFSEENAQLVLKYYNEALASIDAAKTVSEVTTAVSTFKAQVASVEAAAQNTANLTGLYVLVAVALVAVIAVLIVVLLKKNRAAEAEAQPAAQPAQAVAQPAEQAQEIVPAVVKEPVQEEPTEEETALAADADGDKEQVVIAANVRSFAEAYVELNEELLDLFNKVKDYALTKEGATEVKQSSGVCIKRNGKQIVKLTIRRGYPVALFLLENEMLKDFRRTTNTNAKLKVHATELVLREETDLEAAFTMVDLSVEQIDKDIESAKERRREARRARRKQKQMEEEALKAQSQEIAADETDPVTDDGEEAAENEDSNGSM